MDVQDVSDRIIEQLPTMAPQVALCARHIVDHPDAMVISSMREIAGQVGVAPATLLRLARSLGYTDWSRFREAYVARFRSSSPQYAERADALVKRQGVPGLVVEMARAQKAALDHASSANSPDAIDEASKILNRAPRIFVAAFMSCRAPGLAFTYICRLFRSNVIMVGADGSSPLADLRDLRSDDAVLAINFVPYSREIHLVADAVARSGAALVSISDSRVTPLSPHASSILLFGAESPSFFPSITAAVGLVESLAAAMLAHAGEGAVKRVAAVEEALYAFGSYEPPSRSV